jgi:hypothetical protein
MTTTAQFADIDHKRQVNKKKTDKVEKQIIIIIILIA